MNACVCVCVLCGHPENSKIVYAENEWDTMVDKVSWERELSTQKDPRYVEAAQVLAINAAPERT